MLALRTMAGDELKNDANKCNIISFRGIRCVDLYDRNKHLYRTWTVETARKYFVPSFVRPSHFDAYIVRCFALVL